MPLRRLSIASVIALLTWTATAQTVPEGETEKLSYTIGVQIGRNLSSQPLVLEREYFFQGLEDALDEKDLQLSEEEMQRVWTAYRRAQQQKQEQAAAANEQRSRDFMEDNRQKEGVQTHSSGVQYKVIREGDGDKPTAEDTITVHYEGRLIDGTVFDSSYRRGEPVTFELNRVIKGWQIALPLMSVGAKWRLFIPPELGYGEQGAGPDIRPNAALVFDVELISIE